MPSTDQLLIFLEQRDPASSREIQQHLGLSQATVSRLLRRAGERVVKLGRGRATRYAAARGVFGAGLAVPLYAVDGAGVVSQLGTLRSLSGGQYLLQSRRLPFWLLGEAGSGLFDSLPYFLYDLRPAGFLGRLLARKLAAEWGFPADPRLWQDQHIGQFLLRRGDDRPGNLVLGEAAALRANQRTVPVVEDREVEYPLLARRTLGDESVGSSAAGEQPKFAVYQQHAGHVIVKFSPAGDSAEAVRWQDLLRAEFHALEVLRERQVPAAESALYEFGGRVFLESRRFDRHGPGGRTACLSLALVDAEFGGVGPGWARVAAALHGQGLLDRSSLQQVTWAEVFGAWIGNTDMHLHNVSLAPAEEGFRLLPLYDMLPMAFAPARGELPDLQLSPPLRTDLNAGAWAAAGEAALSYWQRLAEDHRLSADFRAVARHHGGKWGTLLGG